VTPSREEREKYGTQIKEYILEDNACPLAILMKHPSNGSTIIFQIRRCTPDILAIRKQKKKAEQEKQQQQQQQKGILQPNNNNNLINKQTPLTEPTIAQVEAVNNQIIDNMNQKKFPLLVELSYEGFELPQARVIQLKSDFYEFGSDKFSQNSNNFIRIDPNIPGIDKKHCAIKKNYDNTQIMLIPYAETYVNDRLIKEPVQLMNNFTLRLGKFCVFKLENMNETAPKNIPIQQQQHHVIPPNYGVLYESGQVAPDQPRTPTSNIQNPLLNQQNPTKIPINNQMAINNNVSGGEPGLPGLLEFSEEAEKNLLATICSTNQSICQFKLAPVYTLYMMLRYRLSQKYKPDLTLNEKLSTISLLIHKMVNYIREAVDMNHLDRGVLPYWLANSSELLYFLKQDVHLSQISFDAQEALADCVQITFKYLVNIMQQQFDAVLGAFFDPSDHVDDLNIDLDSHNIQQTSQEFSSNNRPSIKHVIQVLNQTMSLLRGSRVNAALTIQLFSQLFHYISMWLFNKLVGKDQRIGLCSKYWGEKLLRRLSKIQLWAERQGLELAADCHLQRIMQSAFFLQASKCDPQELSNISSNCFSLNSIQLKYLLKNYLLGPNEPPLNIQLCNNLISIAQNTADEVIKQEGRLVQLEEELDLQLPFLLPEDGHSCEIIKGLPSGLLDFLEGLQNSGLCWLWQNTQGPGSWKKFMSKDSAILQQQQKKQQQSPAQNIPVAIQPQNSSPIPQQPLQKTSQPVLNEPQIVKIRLNKKNGGLGLSIVAAKGISQITGIYIKSIVPGGAADGDGRLGPGDQLLCVDEHSLINVTQEKAAELMTKSGPIVILTVAKDSASFNGLEALLCRSSPMPQQQQLPITSSLPSLNSQNINFSVNNPGQIVTAATLPRNHHLHQQQQQQTKQDNHVVDSAHSVVQPSQSQILTARQRSMSQEILNRAPQQQQQQQAPKPQVAPRPNFNQQHILSPTNSSNHHHIQRTLPNEQQIRYGSERPVSMHQLQIQQHQQQQFNNNHHQVVRNLPNELVPRFGSERPAPTQSMIQQHHNINHHSRRFNSVTDTGTSPIRFNHQDSLTTSNNQQQKMQRQASLNELDEINYNNQILHQQQQQLNPQRDPQLRQNSNNNKFDDLYGKVNPNRNSAHLITSTGQNGITIRNTNSSSSIDEQRTKSVSQLYEHIWSQQQPVPSQQQQQNQRSSNPVQTKSIEDIHQNMRQMELGSAQNHPMMHGRISRPNLLFSSLQQQQSNGERVIPIQRIDQINAVLPRNYENQVVSHGQKPQLPPPPALLTKLNHNQITANNPKNFSSMSKLHTASSSYQPQSHQQHQHINHHSVNDLMSLNNRQPIKMSWEQQMQQQQRDEEQFRMNLLQQRIELLSELESKPQRTIEEENRLNKLKTEIEFDRRVLENAIHENEEFEDLNYNNNNLEQRNRVDEMIKHEQETYKINLQMKLKQEEMDRLQEARREEQRLRKHVMNDNQDFQHHHHQQVKQTQQKHVQFMSNEQQQQQHINEFRSNQNSNSANSSPKSNLKTASSSTSSSSDQLDSSPSTPPPPVPSMQSHPQQQQQKRVMFNDTPNLLEFERPNSLNNDFDDILPNTPCVIGANEVYVDKRLKMKQQMQQEHQQEKDEIEVEKLSFKDKMKLFARQTGELNANMDENNKFKVSRKQREIESKFEVK
jgi:hypothetical protein